MNVYGEGAPFDILGWRNHRVKLWESYTEPVGIMT